VGGKGRGLVRDAGDFMLWIIALVLCYSVLKLIWWWDFTANRLPVRRRPLIFSMAWFDVAVFLISIVLVLVAFYLFYRVSPWLIPVPIVFLALGFLWEARKRLNRLSGIVRRVVMLTEDSKATGTSRKDANRLITKELLGHDFGDSCGDMDTHSLLMGVILPQLGLYSAEDDFQQGMAESRRIETMIQQYETPILATRR
jgi:hypothetical protein